MLQKLPTIAEYKKEMYVHTMLRVATESCSSIPVGTWGPPLPLAIVISSDRFIRMLDASEVSDAKVLEMSSRLLMADVNCAPMLSPSTVQK